MMKNLEALQYLSKHQLDKVTFVIKTLERAGFEARIVGGAVRDILLSITPDDIDVATTAKPEEVSKLFSGRFYNSSIVSIVPTGIKHGTITVVVNSYPIEITTLRVDVETDGRHAVVEYTDSWELDAKRRDFTVNALSIDLAGNIYDYFGGIEDLYDKKIKYVGDANTRIEEDKLRALRYFRFLARFGFKNIDEASMHASVNTDFSSIAGERIWKELMKIFKSPCRVDVLDILSKHKILQQFGFKPLSVSPILVIMYFDSFSLFQPSYVVAALTLSVKDLDNVRARLKFDASSYELIKFLISNKPMHTIDEIKEALVRGVNDSHLKNLCKYNGRLDLADWININYANIPKFPVRGADVKNLGYTGKEIGDYLTSLKEAWIKSEYVLSREDLLSSLVEK